MKKGREVIGVLKKDSQEIDNEGGMDLNYAISLAMYSKLFDLL